MVLVGSCSGGETGTGETKTPDGNKSIVKATYIGPITAFGSVFVNGIEFDTNEASISVNGVDANEHSLIQGMLVKIEGQVDATGTTGKAFTISYCSVLDGPISQISRNSSSGKLETFQLLGQTVRVDNFTLIDSKLAEVDGLEALQVGYRIEVSGFQGLREILATHIEVIDAGENITHSYLVNGVIMELTPEYFRINELTIFYDFSSFTERSVPELTTGMFVGVSGHYISVAGSQRFIADRVFIDQHGQSDDLIEIEGYIVEAFNQGVFRFNRFQVSLAADVKFENGDQSSLNQVGLKLHVRGHISSNGIIEAHLISVEKAPSVEFVGELQQIDADQNSIVVFGRRIFINNHTIIKDDTAEKLRTINLSNFIAGDRVETDLQYDADTNLFIASKLNRKQLTGAQDKLKGPLVSVEGKGNNIVVNIAGMELELASSENHLFFNLEAGTIVSVTGSYNSLRDVFEVSSVEFSL